MALESASSFKPSFQVHQVAITELVNFIHVWIKIPPLATYHHPQVIHLNIEENKNSLLRVMPGVNRLPDGLSPCPWISFGKFKRRHEAVYNQSTKSLFAFVIEGAFEVQGRLLQAREGLSFAGHEDAIELEALSNDAIILILELQPLPLK